MASKATATNRGRHSDIAMQTPDWLRQMESILEELNEAVVLIDDQLRIIFANETLVRLSGYQRGELEGVRPEALFPPADLPYLERQHEIRQRYGRNRNEFYLPAKDGHKIPVIHSERVIQGPDGQEYALVILTDISAQKRVEGQLRESNALLEARQKEIEAELALSVRVQESLAPRSLLWNNIAVAACYSPARTIGGDFGVVFPHGDEFLSLLVCDVSGHGISSALMANRIYSEALHELERSPGPGVLLHRLHRFVLERLATNGFFFTLAAARFSKRGRRMAFAAGGNPPALLLSNGSVRLLESQQGILGTLPETAPSESADEVDLKPGDRVVLYTDGLVEVFNPGGEMLGTERLTKLVRDSSTQPPPEMAQAILRGVSNWRHGPLADDVSLLVVEVH